MLSKTTNQLLLEVQGVGYEVMIPLSTYERLPALEQEIWLGIVESVGMYGGGTALYGFATPEEKEIFLQLREVPGTGAKKALEYLDKIAKSFPDFRRAILERDVRFLTSVFGFSKRTAEKLILALKDRLADLRLEGTEKWAAHIERQAIAEALAGLVGLGYRESAARAVLERLSQDVQNESSAPDLIRHALKSLGSHAS
ncbi:MAG: Holliday junction branch migration protein RuvA [Elusimicrobia bacterium]|nr:Holliday junction branch migration protein RuvA [Elusimicrobiota bacterium]